MNYAPSHAWFPPVVAPSRASLGLTDSLAPDSHWVGKAIVTYFAAYPLFWLAGLVMPATFVLMALTVAVTIRMPGALRYAWPWYAVGLIQVVSVIVNWMASGSSVFGLGRHFLGSYVSGWFLLGAAISAGGSGLVSLAAATRALTRLAWYWIVLAIPATALALASGAEALFFVSPLGSLLPDSLPAKTFAFGIYVFSWDDLLGIEWPRIVLFFPWANVLGMAGVAIVLAGIAEGPTRRWAAVAIGVLMVVASLGRMPILALAASLVLRMWLAVRPLAVRVLTVAIPLWIAAGLALAGTLSLDLVERTSEVFEQGRPGSSQARAEVADANWSGFFEAPLLGHGWPGEAVFEPQEGEFVGPGSGMAVGSHSTTSALLYKGGILTMAALVLAFSLTAGRLVARKLASSHERSALCFLVALGIACGAEGIESLVMPLLFVFVWIGAVLAAPRHGSVAGLHGSA